MSAKDTTHADNKTESQRQIILDCIHQLMVYRHSNCLQCDEEFKYCDSSKTGKYCSNQCQRDYEYETIHKSRVMEGSVSNRKTLHRFLVREHGDECSECGVDMWNGKPLRLEVDHIDGDASNNMPDNLRLLCPNCHSQTESFAGRNLGCGRGSKGISIS